VEGLLVDAGRVVGVATDRGPCQAERVVLCSHAAAMELLTPEQRGGLRELTPEPWCEHALPSALVRVEAGGLAELPPGGIAELGTDPAALDAFFSTGDELEAPHACLLEASTGDLVAANPLSGSLVLVASTDPAPLLARHDLPALHGDLGPARVRRGQAWRAVDGLPLVGRVPGASGLFLALGCGRAEALLAPGLAAGLVAELEGRPVAAYDRARLAPARG
jgi:glycine/D-amino acid oxidase-like deaminating enzyme